MSVATQDIPLAVDMDGTLILTDMSWVSIRKVILRKPWLFLNLIRNEISGRRAKWKRALASNLRFDPSKLRYHSEFLDWLTGEHAKGREIILATASDRIVAEQIAGYVGLFSDVMASDGDFNLRGNKKAEALVSRFGENGFGYAGNSIHDMDVWKVSAEIIVVNPDRGLLKKIENTDFISDYNLFR